MHGIVIFLLLVSATAFAQQETHLKLANTGTYNDFLISLGQCIQHKNIPEIKKSFLVIDGKPMTTPDHDELYLHPEKMYKENNALLHFGKLLQQTPKKITDVTFLAQKKAKQYGIRVEKAYKVVLNSPSKQPHFRDVIVVHYKHKWYLVDY